MGVRLNVNRDGYKIPTGMYAFGQPNEKSEVIITGNYKLTFDYLRKHLKKDYWVLIIDTDGINVWCAAGKGRFGTAEVIRMLKEVDLKSYVSHKRIILPQLSAPGIQSQLITKQTGYKVNFGPVRIQDMDEYTNDFELTEQMRSVTFGLKDRLTLVPIELVSSLKILLISLLLSLIPFVPVELFYIVLAGSLLGNVFIPVLLPYLPFKMFYKKGLLLSLSLFGFLVLKPSILTLAFIMVGGIYTSYLAMNFTGSTTFTSLSGVKKEMEEAIPFMIKAGIVSLVVLIVGIIMEVL